MIDGTYPDGLPEEDRLRCMYDELVYGTSYVEMTADGPRRVDPTEAITCHD